MRRITAPPHRTALLAALLPLLVVTACDGGAADDDGGANEDGDDAGVVDAGDPYTGPRYEVVDGFFPDDGPHRDPARCGASEYRWWGVPALGDVEQHELKQSFSTTLLTTFKSQLASSIKLARDPVYDVALYRIRYTTQDRGSLTSATGIVAYPVVSAPTEVPLVLYLHGTVGFVDACSPSSGIDSIFQANYVSAATIAMFASWGYVVVAPDYLGLMSTGGPSPSLHPYLVAEPTAIASLDAVRAGRKLLAELAVPVTTSSPVAVLGVSQGGHAAAFTVRYQPHYAHDVEIAGAVYAVPPLDLVGESEVARASTDPVTKGNAAAFLATALAWYGDTAPLSDAIVPPHDDDARAQIEAVCGVPSLDADASELFTPALLDGTLEPFACFGAENGLLTTSIPRTDDVPALMILAEDDALVSRAVERAAFVTLCDEGVPLELKECRDASHVQGFTFSIDDAFAWLDARLAGAPLENVCALAAPEKCASDPR